MDAVIDVDNVGSAVIADYWRAKATLSHEWNMLMYRFQQDARNRRIHPAMSDAYWSHVAELQRAQAVFYAQYLIASALSELAREGMSWDYLVMFTLSEAELKSLL